MRALIPAVSMLLLGAPAAAQTPDWSNARTVEIEMSSFAYTPDTISLRRGIPYRLYFVNNAGGGHNFVAKDFFASATIDPADQTALSKGKVELEGGKSADVRLVANRPGTYKVHCSHFMHSTFGMTGKIVVQ
ncbi:cupredoxin domain-containing protein [Sphingomonas sanxanigenens]|uniref:Copper binding s, plastocyanin/azurin family protein n=1 Tax=Sphingomonas sanxanigenens DSM 19645 = NX02 TaxID=1123269 RepID=A0A0F7JT60_9SPHN|nr:cupredoxin domain-containing protein [Sphingomonas sanxanigenens]AKH18847.1 copper binding s, plastocyanin/azurin family protein [Sphingomonas sanxanigenens DSM 19645 = NX02]